MATGFYQSPQRARSDKPPVQRNTQLEYCSRTDSSRPLRAAHFGCVPGAPLALGTVVAAASCDHDAANGTSAARAGSVGFLVHAKPLKIISRPAFDVDVVAESSSLKIDGALEHFLHRAIQPVSGGGRNPIRLGKGMNAGFKQGLVRINISQAGNALLV